MFLPFLFLLVGGAALPAAAEGCHGDNLLRAMERHNGSAYCSSLLSSAINLATTTLQPPEGVPTTYEPGPVSSACSCLLGLGSSSSASTLCHSRTVTWTNDTASSTGCSLETTVTVPLSSSSADTDSGVINNPIPTSSEIDGGYSFSMPNPSLTLTSIDSTCGWSDVTTTIQVTQTSVSTFYITSLSSLSDGDSGGQPATVTTSSSSWVSDISTLPDSFTTSQAMASWSSWSVPGSDDASVITLTGVPSGTASAWISTITLDGDSAPVLTSTLPGTTDDVTLGLPGVTTITSGNLTIVTSVSEMIPVPTQGGPPVTLTRVINGTTVVITGSFPETTSSRSTSAGSGAVTSSQVQGSPPWTLSWISSSTEEVIGSQVTETSSPFPSVTTITSNVGGVEVTWTLTQGGTAATSSSSSSTLPTASPPTVTDLSTSSIEGVGSTRTLTGGSTFVESFSSIEATVTATPSALTTSIESVIGFSTVVTSSSGGVGFTRTFIGVSTLVGSSSLTEATPTSTPLGTDTGGFTVITTVINGAVTIVTISGGSTLQATPTSNANTTTLAASTLESATGAVTAITSIISGGASTQTIVNGSTLVGSTASTTPAGGVITWISTGVGGGGASTWTLNSTIATGSATASTSGTASPTATGYASAFTEISVVAAVNASTCYELPVPTSSLREALLDNTGRSPPYIDAFYLNPTTNSVNYLRLVDDTSDPILIDVSDPSRLAIIDKDGDVLSIDSQGLHFTSANCSPKIDVFISGFFGQLNALTNSTCENQTTLPVNGTGDASLFLKREYMKRQESSFDVVLRLRDQCGNPASTDLPVAVALGDTQCVVAAREPGDFVANCAFPGGESGPTECETSVRQTLNHLTDGSLAGTCPSFKSVWSLLFQQLDSVINPDELLKPFVDAGLDIDTDLGRGILSVIDSFLDVYDYSTSTFRNSTTEGGSDLGDMIESYGTSTITTQVCRSLNQSEALNLTFTAGPSPATPATLDQISAVPSSSLEYERNVTDPAALACCPNPSKCVVEGDVRFYPPEASIEGSDCLCGTSADGPGIAFRTGRCLGYDQCSATSPCAGGGVCLVDNCCGFSVCVNGTECSAPRAGRRWLNLFETETSAGML